MKNIFIIGAGQLGSRHLQALKNSNNSLNVFIIDPSSESLNIANERYESMPGIDNNTVSYSKSLNDINCNNKIDIVIIATASNVRANVTRDLLDKFEVKTIIFEKILFQKREDYSIILELLKSKNVKSYVNCPMRMMSFYKEIQSSFKGTKFTYMVSGSQYGLVTNLIHYIDHMAFLNQSIDYTCNANLLENNIFESKRKGFYELNGTFNVYFKNGTQGIFSCESKGNLPGVVQAFNENVHFISRESEGKVLISRIENDWKWEEIEFNIPYQSELTAILVEDILMNDSCSLPSYEESVKLHLPYLDSILELINSNTQNKFNHYPFT
tara:strand:+ start:1919 stop:2896 length:978 start_codon:yes stop_codon:yes gene_type:complete